MNATPPPNPGKAALLRALPILLFTILFGIILALLAWRGVRNAGDISAESQEFGHYARVCAGTPLPVASVFDRQTPEHPTVVFHESPEGWLLDRSVIPVEVFPSSLGDVQLVLCIGLPEEVSLPACADDVPAGQETVTGSQRSLRLIAAATGAVIMRDTLGMGADADCWPAGEPVPADASQEEIWAWLKPFVIASE